MPYIFFYIIYQYHSIPEKIEFRIVNNTKSKW